MKRPKPKFVIMGRELCNADNERSVSVRPALTEDKIALNTHEVIVMCVKGRP
jgi:hypothetical protein